MDTINEAPECDCSIEEGEYVNEKKASWEEDNSRKDDKNILLAATYVEDARIGRHSDFIPSEEKLKLYHLYYSMAGQWLITLLLIIHALLALFEEPTFPDLKLSNWATIPIEIFILSCYALRIAHIKFYTPTVKFIKDPKHIILILLIVFSLCDMIIYLSLLETGNYNIRWSRCLRPLFAVNFPEMRQIRRSFRNMIRTLPDVFNVLVLLFFSLMIFSLMAFKLFGNRNLKYASGDTYFETYLDSFFDLYVLVTTANHPDVMMPAFDINMWYVLFFVVFVVLCFFIYMNIILAVIYNNYRENLKNEVKISVLSKHKQLLQAFELISVKRGVGKVVTKDRFFELIRTLPQHRSTALLNVLWMVLDTTNTNVLDKEEFYPLADLLNVEVIEVVSKSTFIGRRYPHIYNSSPSKILRKIVSGKVFQSIFDILTVLNAAVIAISKPDSLWDDPVEWSFLCLFLAEIALKLYTFGGVRFFKKMWHTFDFVVIGSAFILATIELIYKGVKESRLALDVLLVLRVLRLVKVIGSIKRFKVIISTINKILPSLLNYGSIILIIYYIFAIIGMEIFSNKVIFLNNNGSFLLFCGNDKLNGSLFWRSRYCNNNFNDIVHAFIVLFELTVVNQWHVIVSGYVAVTDPLARIYFVVFHMVCVIVVLNIFTAFVLEVFMLEYCANKGHLESQVERKIHEIGLSTKSDKQRRCSTLSNQSLVPSDYDTSDDEPSTPGKSRRNSNLDERRASVISLDRSRDTDVRFHISKKVRSVEVLLQKMFERELSQEVQMDSLQERGINERIDNIYRRPSFQHI